MKKHLSWLKPQPKKFREALTYSGVKSKETWLLKLFKNHTKIFVWIERIVMLSFFIYCIFSNNFRLWLLTVALGAMLALRGEFKFMYWYLKVTIFKRNYYKDRRLLYQQGTLFYHFFSPGGKKVKKKHFFKKTKTLIWSPNPKIASIKYKTMNQKREYIKL